MTEEIIKERNHTRRKLNKYEIIPIGELATGLESDYSNIQHYIDKFSGVKNPNWRSQVAAFVQSGTPMTGGKTIVHSNEKSTTLFRPRYSQPHNWPYHYDAKLETTPAYIAESVDPSLLTVPNNNADNLAASYIHEKINSAFTALQGGVVAGESRESISMIKNRGSSIFQSASDFLAKVKKPMARKARAYEYVRRAADMYLELTFGWQPLLSDIDSAIDYANTTFPDRKVVGATADVDLPSDTFISSVGSGIITHNYRVRIRRTCSVRYIAGVESKDSRDGMKFQKLGISPEHWLPTVYELIPYSFLVDYFANLDSIVAAIGNCFVDTKWVVRTTKITHVIDVVLDNVQLANVGSPSLNSSSTSKGECKIEQTRVERDLPSGVPIPGLVFHLPGSTRRIANMAALGVAHREARTFFSKL